MRFKRSSTQRSGNESAASSVKSSDSYGVFGSACSDFSECGDGEYRNTAENTSTKMTSRSSSGTSLSGAEREVCPLLLTSTANSTYKSITTSSDTLGPAELSGSDIIATYKRLTVEKNAKPTKNKQNSLVTIFSIWNTIMGSSLLTMAWGVQRAGLPAALFLLAFMAALCLYTAYLLLRVNVHHGSDTCEVPELCRTLLGPGAAGVAHAFSLLVLVGASVVYWLLITNFLYYTVNYLMDINASNVTEYNTSLLCPRHEGLLQDAPGPDPSPYWGLHTTVPIYVAIIIFPLLNFTNVSFFTKFNSLGTLSVFYLLLFVIVKGWIWGIHLSVPEHSARAAAAAVAGAGAEAAAGAGTHAAVLSGMLALSFYIHNIIISIMSNNAKQENNGRDLSIAFSLVTATYTLVGAVFYICFPIDKTCIEDNILNNFEMHDVMTAIARALLLFQVITVYPLVVYMLRRAAWRLLETKCSQSGPLSVLSAVSARTGSLTLNLALVTLCVVVACLCPDMGTIIRYTGAVSGLVHVFALPALLHMRSLHLRGRLTAGAVAGHSLIVVFGAANLLLQFFVT